MDFEDRLIELVKANTILYEDKVSNYETAAKKRRIWKTIGRQLNTSDVRVKKRWRSLRDTYRRKKTRELTTEEIRWKYNDSMNFIDESNGKITQHSRTAKTQNKSSFLEDVEYLSDASSSTSRSILDSFKAEDVCLTDANSIIEIEPVPLESSVEITQPAAPPATTHPVNINLPKSAQRMRDPFLAVIGEVFGNVPEEQKLAFKMDIINYVYSKYNALSK